MKTLLQVFTFSAILQGLFPTALNQFHVHTVAARSALYIRVSKTSPPLAALDDAQLRLSDEVRPPEIVLAPFRLKIRVLPGIRISQREIPVEAPTIIAQPIVDPAVTNSVDRSVASRENIYRPVNTHEYSGKRAPKIINFKELMNRIKGQSTAANRPVDSSPVEGVTTFESAAGESPKSITYVQGKTADAFESHNPYTEASYEISGSVELDGAVYEPGHKLVVYRELNGRIFESTPVQAEASFSLKAPAITGFLIGELRNGANEVIARDEKWLDRMPKHGQKLSGVKLKLKAVSESVTLGRTSSANGADVMNSPVGGVAVSAMGMQAPISVESGKFELRGLLPDSSMIVKAEKKGFFGSVMLASARQSLPIMLYPQKMVGALVDIVGTPQGFTLKDFAKYGIVWGRVNSKKGQAVSGAKIEITDSRSIGPIYFNELYLPDSKLQATSSNGMFVFLRVEKGTTVIRANQGGRMMPMRIVPIEANYVSHVDLEATEKEHARIFVMDAFKNQPVPSEVRFAGASRSAKTSPEGWLQTAYSKNLDPLILEIDPEGDYAPVKFHTSRNGHEFAIPVISNDWLNGLRLNQGPEFGSIIGFTDGQRVDVFMDINGKAHQEIYYFNASGELVAVPVQGGGFIIANVPVGLRTVSMAPEGSPAIFSQVLSVDSGYVAVMSKRF